MVFTIKTDNDCEDCNIQILRINKIMNEMSGDDELIITIVRDRRDLDQYHIEGSKWSS